LKMRVCLNGHLANAIKNAEASSEAKSQFLANMSHEIRTPLGAILGFVDLLLLPDAKDEERADWAQRVKTNGEHLLKLINDILNLSKVESGKVDLANEEVDLAPLLTDIEGSFALGAKSKGIEFKVHLINAIPSCVKTDSTRLRQILTNIISNAIKFTDKGFVSVGTEYKDGVLYFTVTDTGPGLTQEQADRLFKPFNQADMAHAHTGTGLGLVLARRLARLMGGDVELLSTGPGKGSQFKISVQVEPVAEKPMLQNLVYTAPCADEKSKRAESLRLDGKNILVVDDAPDNQILMSRILTRQGAAVAVAGNCETAIKAIELNHFDLILMDIQMPGKDGYETTKILREKGLRAPIIALTAHALPHEREKSLKAGLDDHITKPIDRQNFLETISHYLSSRFNMATH
jgi:two-component system, sensor histidine kinase